MTMFIRGTSGIIEMMQSDLKRLENRVANDDKLKAEKQPGLRVKDRVEVEGQIHAYNWIIGTLTSARILTEEDYDRRFPPATHIEMVTDHEATTDGFTRPPKPKLRGRKQS